MKIRLARDIWQEMQGEVEDKWGRKCAGRIEYFLVPNFLYLQTKGEMTPPVSYNNTVAYRMGRFLLSATFVIPPAALLYRHS